LVDQLIEGYHGREPNDASLRGLGQSQRGVDRECGNVEGGHEDSGTAKSSEHRSA
jgi:hypothetical protein